MTPPTRTCTPTREDRFSFGLWTVGWQGVDVFGGAIRPPLDPAEAVHRLADLGAYGITFHDNDVFPFGADAAEQASAHLAPFRKALEETGLVVPMVTTNLFSHPVFRDGGFTNNDRDVRRFALRKAARQHRPGRRARREDVRRLGRPRGRRVRRRQGHAGRARPLQGGLRPARRRTSSTRATTSGSRSSPSPTSPAATSCCRRSVTRWPSSTSSSTPSWSGSTPRSGTRRWPALNYAHGLAQALWHGKLFHIDLNGQTGPRYDQDLRFGAGNARGAFWTVDIVENGGYDGPRHFDFKPPRTEDMDGVWASAAGCMRNYLILRDKVRAFRADPEVQAGAARRARRPARRSRPWPPARRSPTCAPRRSTPTRPAGAAWASSTSTSSPSSTCTASAEAVSGTARRGGRLLDAVLQGRRPSTPTPGAWSARAAPPTPTAPRSTRRPGGPRCDEAIAAAGGLDDVAAVAVGGQQHGMVCLDEAGGGGPRRAAVERHPLRRTPRGS